MCFAANLLLAGSCAGPGPAPLVVPLHDLATPLTFNGRSARFAFDTGAGAHAFASWFADAAGLPVDRAANTQLSGRDFMGIPVDLRTLGRVVGQLPSGDTLVIESAVVADFLPEMEQAGLGGLLNPQLLAGEGEAAVLDLRVPELRIERFDVASRRLGAQSISQAQVQSCRESDAPVANLRYALRAEARGETGWLTIDTGAEMTTLDSDSPLVSTMDLDAGGEVMGVGGVTRNYSIARDLSMSFPGGHVTLDARVVDPVASRCGSDGVLGRDVLSRCALVLGRESLATICG
ncbi:MAG: aspartyl protease family protein [Gammaproteobacteria bacterium]|nr:aspartyl protease family protein [Gammaproteobacteria bacterium]